MSDFLERMRARAARAEAPELTWQASKEGSETKICPGCGAGRAQAHGVAECRYCGYVFINRLAGPAARRDPTNPAF